jgi:hypothetical protein
MKEEEHHILLESLMLEMAKVCGKNLWVATGTELFQTYR